MPRRKPERVAMEQVRKETREWIQTKTIPTLRDIAKDLENAGEDVHDLLQSIDELEGLVRRESAGRPGTKAKNRE
jgi:hypothetical protein